MGRDREHTHTLFATHIYHYPCLERSISFHFEKADIINNVSPVRMPHKKPIHIFIGSMAGWVFFVVVGFKNIF